MISWFFKELNSLYKVRLNLGSRMEEIKRDTKKGVRIDGFSEKEKVKCRSGIQKYILTYIFEN